MGGAKFPTNTGKNKGNKMNENTIKLDDIIDELMEKGSFKIEAGTVITKDELIDPFDIGNSEPTSFSLEMEKVRNQLDLDTEVETPLKDDDIVRLSDKHSHKFGEIQGVDFDGDYVIRFIRNNIGYPIRPHDFFDYIPIEEPEGLWNNLKEIELKEFYVKMRDHEFKFMKEKYEAIRNMLETREPWWEK